MAPNQSKSRDQVLESVRASKKEPRLVTHRKADDKRLYDDRPDRREEQEVEEAPFASGRMMLPLTILAQHPFSTG